jgi:imidazole glycerol-phosphate synthase subunit HisF
MRNIRLIARLDVKGSNLIKGIHLEGLRVIGKPNDYALRYYNQGIDELIYMDSVASLYGRNSLGDIIKSAAQNIFVPMTVGGGLRSVDDVRNTLRCGADKVAINSAAVRNPKLISDIASRFGSQCMVLSVEAKRISVDKWEVYIDNGREKTQLDVIEWVKEAVDLGAGEILLTSIDQEGTREGFDISLVENVTNQVPVPVIASGGMGKQSDLSKVVLEGNADAVAMADILHYERETVDNLRQLARSEGIQVREV